MVNSNSGAISWCLDFVNKNNSQSMCVINIDSMEYFKVQNVIILFLCSHVMFDLYDIDFSITGEYI